MPIKLSPRQVHLDFHTSEHIPGIAEDFSAASFAKTVKDAHISSMTVFARCHHGWLYYFCHPILSQYRDNAPRWCKTLTVTLLDQPNKKRYVVHLLSYIPVRKSATIDIIEERTAVRDLTLELALPNPIRRAALVPEQKELVLEGKSLIVPLVDGYAIIELSY
jgi:hypothetical protein